MRLTGIAVLREAVGTLLPVRVGGELAGIRLLMRSGLSGVVASASVVVEVTLWLLAQVLFAVVGLVLLIGATHAGRISRYGAVGLLIAAAAVAAFMLVQRRGGLFAMLDRLLGRIAGRAVMRAVGDPARIDDVIRALYQNPRALAIVAIEGHCSPTVTALDVSRCLAPDMLIRGAAGRGYTLGSGYGKLEATTMRIGHMGDHTVEELGRCLEVLEAELVAKR